MKRLLYILLLVISWNTLTAQTYQVNNQKIRFMNALGIPAKDTAAANWANAADTSIILIRPQDSTLWYKYKGNFRKVGTGGSAAIVDTTIISTKGYRNKGTDSISAILAANYVPYNTAMSNVNLNARELSNVSKILVNRTSGFQGALQVTTNGGGILVDADNSNFGITVRNTSSSNKSWDISPFNNDFTINESGIAPRIYLQAGGNNGINTITPTEALDVNGNVKATSFIKSGGTSSQFLKADGSVDGNSYLSNADSATFSTKAWRQKGDDSVSALISPRITDSLRALVRLRASGSGGIQLQNSNGTNVADFGTANTTNGSIAGGWNVGGNLAVTGTSGFTGKATFSDSIVGVNQRLTGRLVTSGDVGVGTLTPSTRLHVLGNATEVRVESSSSSDGFIRYVNTSGSMSFGMSGAPSNAVLLYDRINNQNAYEYTGGVSGGHKWYYNGSELISLNSSGLTFSSKISATAQGNNITVGVDSSVTSTSYTLVLADAGYLKRCSNASAITITVPTNASVAFPIGTTIYLSQQGAGKVSVSPATSDVTIQSEGNLLGTAAQHAVIGLIKVNTNRWLLIGNRG